MQIKNIQERAFFAALDFFYCDMNKHNGLDRRVNFSDSTEAK